LLTRRRLPAPARPKLVRDERVIAWAATSTGPSRCVVVTNLGLWLPDRERLGWHQIHKAAWSGSRLTVVPAVLVDTREGYDVTADDSAVQVDLVDAGNVPAEIRTRVTRSVVHTSHHVLAGGGVRVVSRRRPGVNGVHWQVRYDEGTDPADPAVVDATQELVAEYSTPTPD
jgi:hypothetical protein